jgi:hypothetical protein
MCTKHYLAVHDSQNRRDGFDLILRYGKVISVENDEIREIAWGD